MIALIDGDILVYRCAFAGEKTKYLTVNDGFLNFYDAHKDIPKSIPKESIWSRKEIESEDRVLQATEATLNSILNKLGTTDYEIYLSGERSFREELAVTKKYKGNRDGQVRPVHYSAARSFINSMPATRVCENGGYEADDAIGIRATSLGDECVIVSIDKDLHQIAGRHFNWTTDESAVVDRRHADINLGCQIISGDATDNIPGLPGYGEVKSRKLLQHSTGSKQLLSTIRDTYRSVVGDGWERYLMEQGSLVYILREEGKTFADWYNERI